MLSCLELHVSVQIVRCEWAKARETRRGRGARGHGRCSEMVEWKIVNVGTPWRNDDELFENMKNQIMSWISSCPGEHKWKISTLCILNILTRIKGPFARACAATATHFRFVFFSVLFFRLCKDVGLLVALWFVRSFVLYASCFYQLFDRWIREKSPFGMRNKTKKKYFDLIYYYYYIWLLRTARAAHTHTHTHPFILCIFRFQFETVWYFIRSSMDHRGCYGTTTGHCANENWVNGAATTGFFFFI